jgi:hypothetical protein
MLDCGAAIRHNLMRLRFLKKAYLIWLLGAVLCAIFWVFGLILSDVKVLDAPLYQPIFFQMNPLFWVSLAIAVAMFVVAATIRRNNKMLLLSLSLILLVLGVTPYLVEMGRTYDSYMYYDFSLFTAQSGHLMQPQSSSSLFYFEWPGLIVFGSIVSLILNTNNVTILVKSFPILNLTLFALGVYILSQKLFSDKRKSAFSVLFVFLGSTLTSFDFSPDWATFALVPILLATSLQRGTKWKIISLILFSYITFAHPFNSLMVAMILLAVYVGNRLSGNSLVKSLAVSPILILGYFSIYLTWNTFSGSFIWIKVSQILSSLTIKSGTTTVITVIGANLYFSETLNRLILIALFLGVLSIFILKKLGKNVDKELVLCWPTLLMIGLTFFVTYVIREPDFIGRTFTYSALLGFPVIASLLITLIESRPLKHVHHRLGVVGIVALLVCLMVISYSFSAYNQEIGYTVSNAYLTGSQFIVPHVSAGTVVMGGDLYATMSNNLTQISIASLSDESVAYNHWATIIVIQPKWLDWYSVYDPSDAAGCLRVESYVTQNTNRIYDNGYLQIYNQVKNNTG